jgi:hypothetical protein
MLLVQIPWAGRVWALPFLSALAPSERYAQPHRRRHKPVTRWARQLIRLVDRWLPDRTLVVVGDRGYAALDLLDAVAVGRGRSRSVAVGRGRSRPSLPACAWMHVWWLQRLRVSHTRTGVPASWGLACRPWTRYAPIQRRSGRPSRLPAGTATATAASSLSQEMPSGTTRGVSLCPSGGCSSAIPWASLRPKPCSAPTGRPILSRSCSGLPGAPQMEGTFHQVRAHLGVETQRQWSERAIARTTPDHSCPLGTVLPGHARGA